MKKYMMIHDENLCIGCQACSVACRNEHEVADGVYRVQVHSIMEGKFPNLRTNFERKSCVMCEESPCVNVCPTGASFKTQEGIVLVNQRYCVGCNYCILACPYDARFINPITKTIEKCTFCYETRLKEGLNPACVTVCPTDALIFGDAKDPNSDISKHLASNRVEYPQEYRNTKPSLGYIKNKKGMHYE